ncbi:HPP family protein [Sphingomonas sp. CLY1604]|uniref:HPP family protein n=1 Tax=Sphingomonas sp. CLY1604 TaxID=3457786 RepID=UPI003FD8E0D1
MHVFRPILAGGAFGDRLLASAGAACGIAFAGLFAAYALGLGTLPLLVAPIGASAVLVFAVPASPLAQPWAVIGGNALSGAWALLVVHAVPHEATAAGLAVGGAILVMSLLRCLHPPGGAVALSVVLAAAGPAPLGWGFPLSPVALDSTLLVLAGVAFHRLSGHAYPHHPAAAPPSAFAPEDIDAALADMHETFDIAREDLDALLARAAHHAGVRRRRRGRSSPPR